MHSPKWGSGSKVVSDEWLIKYYSIDDSVKTEYL